MLRLAGARLLDERDGQAVRAVFTADPVASCMVAARVESVGLDPWRLGGEVWGCDPRGLRGGGRLDALCFAGPNLIPLRGKRSALRAFADRALRRRRMCSSMVGPAEQVLGLWAELGGEWGPAREVREDQPLMAIAGPPRVTPDPLVRAVRPDELERYLPAAVAMFIEEVGIDPRAGDGGAGYRARVAELIAAGRAFARFEGGEVVFKAEIGALSSSVGQIQGVWVHPDRRGEGLAGIGTAAVVERLVTGMDRTASLYVNAYNSPARAVYDRIGFTQVGQYATVLF
ncbi:GNAT family N-acetyltransferase [Actinokineospora bangkokensis]|uniref:GNAT family N-acetyltransferase n=1 Tax=Actinokineospora bangkokensis TaxID=1193682 RepID=A0A1Q9LHL9_9PSEU|nr:GNAT family N-acetyltransferase [Actinokineospora bangkokensis]OLR91515.1 GNAT family N-acetyltransferase [Actinokineospora bangkokensis]